MLTRQITKNIKQNIKINNIFSNSSITFSDIIQVQVFWGKNQGSKNLFFQASRGCVEHTQIHSLNKQCFDIRWVETDSPAPKNKEQLVPLLKSHAYVVASDLHVGFEEIGNTHIASAGPS